jgi:hypothetical protein
MVDTILLHRQVCASNSLLPQRPAPGSQIEATAGPAIGSKQQSPVSFILATTSFFTSLFTVHACGNLIFIFCSRHASKYAEIYRYLLM